MEICRRLDGIPLGIELAASRMLSMTATEVRDRLDDRFRLLVGSRRGLERHQTLRHAVQWSYDLLDADEQALLNRCSVFAGGFDLAGATGSRRRRRRVRRSGSARCPGAQIASGRRPLVGPDTILDAGDHPTVRRGTTRPHRRGRSRRAPRTPITLRHARMTYWRCGTARDSERPTTGSPSSWRICAPHFAGLPTTTTSTPQLPLRLSQHSSARWPSSTSRSSWAEELIEPAQAVAPPPPGIPICSSDADLPDRTDRRCARYSERARTSLAMIISTTSRSATGHITAVRT